MSIAFRLLLALALLAAPYFAHAQVGIWLPCRETSAYSEGRTVYIARYMQINTVGMQVDDLENRYCVTQEKCVALGYCKAASPAEQAAADKANPGAAAERARLEREQRQREAQAELQRKAAEAERNRKAAEVARETQRLGSHREAEARRLVEMREAAARARGGPAAASARPPEPAGDARKVCTSAPFRTTVTSMFKTNEAGARTDFAQSAAHLCRTNTGNPAYTGAVSCVREDRSLWAQMPVAQMAKRPANDPPRFEFKCSAPIVCAAPKETCKTVGTVKSSGQ
ncbi:hypothetical protein [Pseudoxanthomonas sp. PXM01]|uniref:hypothetical protein n=1 Tax=Pseudoxanthomonas sp. PXM01 TaxID=2769295 RepID=UPI00177A7721|nr:hypothetical protein [Pseudoxanthomonas sp. PXM01]MBD9471196.1 hypothetical protein [Pseudoxanthomonas sp. PXM01]